MNILKLSGLFCFFLIHVHAPLKLHVCLRVCVSQWCMFVCLSVLTLWVYACHAGSSRQRLSKALRVLCCLSGFTVVPSARLAGLACPLSCLPDSGSSVLGFVWRSGALHTAVDTTQRKSKSHSPPLSSPPHTHTQIRSGHGASPAWWKRGRCEAWIEAIVILNLGCQKPCSSRSLTDV